jgi:hypothetical protein
MKTARDLFQLERLEWIEDCRSTAKNLLQTRENITIEDVLEVCPRPSYIHRNVTGQIFKDNDFISVGYVPARKPSSNGRVIRLWGLREYKFPSRRLELRERMID